MKFKVLGTNDDKNYCEICGKIELKKVVWIENIETGEIFHAGINCAAKKLNTNSKNITKKIIEFKKAQRQIALNELLMTPEYSDYAVLKNRYQKGTLGIENYDLMNQLKEIFKIKEIEIMNKYGVEYL